MAITRAQQYRQMLKDGKVAMQGGVKNYLGKQKTVSNVPLKWQSGANKPPTELAYITEAEKKLLLKEDIHGSLKEGPNTGPEGIMSLDSQGDKGTYGDTGQSYGDRQTTDTSPEVGDDPSPQDLKDYEKNKKAREKDPYYGTKLEGSGVTPTTSIATKEQEKQAKKEARKFRRETKKTEEARRKSKLKAILAGKKTYNTFKIDPKTGKLVEDEELSLGTNNPFGINDKEYQDLISSLPSYKGPPETPEQRQERINNYLTKNIASTDLSDPLTQLMEKNDRFSGVNLEAFQNEFNLPKTGLTGLDVALGFAEPFLAKGSKKTKEFFSGTEDGLKDIFGRPKKSVLEAGKYTIDGLPISPEQFAMLDPALMDDVYKDYMGKRMSGETDAYGNPNPNFGKKDDDPMDPCKGPNPPAYCFVNQDPTTPTTPTPTRNLGGLAPRFAGSIFDFTGMADGGRVPAMDGGIMNADVMGGMADGNIDEAGRQMYFLGKLVKKATRAVKKVAKSPFGKAALFAAPFLMNPAAKAGIGSFFGKGSFNPLKALITTTGQDGAASGLGLSKLGQIFNKFGMATGEGDLTLGGKIGLGFGLPFVLDALGVGKKDDDKMDLDDYYKRNSINIADIRLNPYNYLAPRFAADGGLMRMGYQEGGDAEPVAKKTMPLIDMDGQEKDYRETGGFVDMGRMERADDVPARLSKNEFVFTADAVRNAGEGDIDKGAEVMYNMMKNLEAGGEVSEESQGLEGARNMFQTSQRLEEVL